MTQIDKRPAVSPPPAPVGPPAALGELGAVVPQAVTAKVSAPQPLALEQLPLPRATPAIATPESAQTITSTTAPPELVALGERLGARPAAGALIAAPFSLPVLATLSPLLPLASFETLWQSAGPEGAGLTRERFDILTATFALTFDRPQQSWPETVASLQAQLPTQVSQLAPTAPAAILDALTAALPRIAEATRSLLHGIKPKAAAQDIVIPSPLVVELERSMTPLIDFSTADIGMLMHWLMSQIAASASEDLREVMKEMKGRLERKNALRKQLAELNAQAKPPLADDPSTPEPTLVATRPPGTTPDEAGRTWLGRTPVPNAAATRLAEQYGLSHDDIQRLYVVYQCVKRDDWEGTLVHDVADFEAWLAISYEPTHGDPAHTAKNQKNLDDAIGLLIAFVAAKHKSTSPSPAGEMLREWQTERSGASNTRQTSAATQTLPSSSDTSAAATRVRDELDSIGEMDELMQTRLQLYMERRQKAFETLSNIMKKQADTTAGITKNLI